MTKVMFVCHGNICRSPMAEFVFKDIVAKQNLSNEFIIDSSATSREEIGNGIHYGTRAKLIEKNIPFDDHHAVQFTKKDYNDYDYILLMDRNNLRNITRIIGEDTENKIHLLLDFASGGDIADPWYTGNFDDTYRDIVEGCAAFLEYLRNNKCIR
ncbi:MAG: low molecular weight phosphotyrosine protein phosphatase [Ruminococcaceae bacterium]|nr:low molecular weight phosphotyrosine protein phosphatase [Oscillospiraceae bacterium]